ncbi:MAG TPA: hypothetical protein VJ714_08115 [Anaerolineae bacterium]|nr:hypothetical protein [Anaerolineae bacterium]
MANRSGGQSRQSRLFLIVVVGLVGLLMLGLLSIAGLVVYSRFLAPTGSPTVVAEVTSTPVATATSRSTAVASPTPGGEGPTATRVVQEGTPSPEGPTPSPGGPTASPGGPTATPQGGGEMAPTGFGPLEALLGGIVLLIVIVFIRRVRLSGGVQ